MSEKSSSGLFGWLGKLFSRAGAKPARPAQEMKAEIVLPTDGSVVSYRVAVEGTHSGIPDNTELWLVVFSEGFTIGNYVRPPIYYPQSSPILRMPGGTWHSVASVGPSEAESRGEKYDILLVAASRMATKQFIKYEQDASARGRWSGMLALPRGTVVLDSVTVTRWGSKAPIVEMPEPPTKKRR